LDGQHGHAIAPQLDEITVGPLGMLNILETQLGLLRVDVPQVERVVQFHGCLKRLDHPDRFYHDSFRADELGIAATLLSWRDQWHMHGWLGAVHASLDTAPSRRLRDMSALDAEAAHCVSPSVGERLALIHAELDLRSVRIAALTLCEPLHTWPLAWKKVLARLPMTEANSIKAAMPGDTMLRRLQSALLVLAEGGQPYKLAWLDDGSVRIVQAETELLAGCWLADQWAKDPDEDCLLVAPDASLLDDLLCAANLPRQGFKNKSALRPPLQIVPLTLEQLWKPVDVHELLKFLTHPICPLPKYARIELADTLANAPGIGDGPSWRAALDKIEGLCEKNGNDWPAIRERIRTWIEHDRHDANLGAPLAAVHERLTLLANHLRAGLADDDPARRSALVSAHAQALNCQRAVTALIAQGDTHIRPQPLRTLLRHATAQGDPHPLLPAQVGARRWIAQPGAAIQAAQHVFWWQLSGVVLPDSWPWSLSEQASLDAAGICLPDVSEQLRQLAIAWQKPVLAATERLTLVLPPEGKEMHPLWVMMSSLFDAPRPPVVFPLEDLLTDPALQPQPHQPLPAAKRWWQLPEGVNIAQRAVESHTSIESFIFNPYAWVLNYGARLRPSSILNISDANRLYGNLTHHLIERYYSEVDNALTQDDAAFLAWFGPTFDALIDQEGAVLRMPGRQKDLESFRAKAQAAMHELRLQLQAADIIAVQTEVLLEGQFIGGKLEGSCDLLLTNNKGQHAIIDMKWSGDEAYRKKLAHNRHLQLALYGEILRQKTGAWPRLAYFLISNAELIATEQDYFPDARLVRKDKSVNDEGAAALWQRFLKTWRWRRDQLDQGLIEVALAEDEESQPPEDALSLEILNPTYSPYLVLAGPGEKQ
jgi:RecB family exonuclease